jgi:hypothetical protein
VIRGTAKGVKDCHNNEGNSDYEESILGGILPRLLSPKPLKGRQHGSTFESSVEALCACGKNYRK